MHLSNNITFVLCILMGFVLISFTSHVATKKALFTKPSHFPPIVYDTAFNRLTREGINLGKKLFYDPILSKTNTISCASCHKQEFAKGFCPSENTHMLNKNNSIFNYYYLALRADKFYSR